MSAPKHFVVIGAGISGLAAAWAAQGWAHARSQPLRVTVLEAGPQVGGKAISKVHEGGWVTEAGPAGFLDNEPVMDRLVTIAGLAKQSAQEAAAHRFVVREGRLREIHAHPFKFAASGILSLTGLARMVRERWVPTKQGDAEESVWEFGARRLGQQATDRLLSPMVQGVFAGDAKEISLQAAFPLIASLEQEYGSLFKALGAKRKERKQSQTKQSSGEASGPVAQLTSFHGGLQSLPNALARKASFAIACNHPVASIVAGQESQWDIHLHGGLEPIPADGVVIATEGWAAANILQIVAPEVSARLNSIPYPAVTALSIGYSSKAASAFPKGFGCLIPRSESQTALGILWDSQIFPGRAPEGHVLVRCLYGGALDLYSGTASTGELFAVAKRELRELFGVQVAPLFHHADRWDQAIPQYNLGHGARVIDIETDLDRIRKGRGPLELAGNALYGVAFGKAATRGWQVGEACAQALQG